VSADYAHLDEASKQALLLSLLRDPRPLRVPGVTYSGQTEEELEIFETARSLLKSFGKQAIRHYISHTETVSDLLEATPPAPRPRDNMRPGRSRAPRP